MSEGVEISPTYIIFEKKLTMENFNTILIVFLRINLNSLYKVTWGNSDEKRRKVPQLKKNKKSLYG